MTPLILPGKPQSSLPSRTASVLVLAGTDRYGGFTASELRQAAGVFSDSDFPDSEVDSIAETAFDYLERRLGVVLSNRTVLDYWGDWSRRLILSAVSPYRAPRALDSFGSVTLMYYPAGGGLVETVPDSMYLFDVSGERAALVPDSHPDLDHRHTHPVSVSYSYAAPALPSGVKDALLVVFKEAFLGRYTPQLWRTEALAKTVDDLCLSYFREWGVG